MTAALFLAYAALVAAALTAAVAPRLARPGRRALLIGPPAWLGYVGLVA